MSNLLGFCPLGRKNCPYSDSYCSDCIKYEKTKKTKQERPQGKCGTAMRGGAEDFNRKGQKDEQNK